MGEVLTSEEIVARRIRAVEIISREHAKRNASPVQLVCVAGDKLLEIYASHEELRARLENAERERNDLRAWAERARDTIADYRRAYGTDHRNQELADALDKRAVGVLRDWRLGDFEPKRAASALRESDDYTVALERVALAAYASTDAEESWQGYVEDRGKMDDALEALDDQHHARWLAALATANDGNTG